MSTEQEKPAGAQGETPRRCEGDQHIADGIGGCQCGNLYARNIAPEGNAQQAEEIARLRADYDKVLTAWAESRTRHLAAESQVQALQVHLTEAQQRIETLTAERNEARLFVERAVWRFMETKEAEPRLLGLATAERMRAIAGAVRRELAGQP